MMKTKFLYAFAVAAVCLVSCNNENTKPALDMTVEFGETNCWIDLETTVSCSVPVVLAGTNFEFPVTVNVTPVESEYRSAESDYSLSATELVFESADDEVSVEISASEGVESLNVELLLSTTSNGVSVGENASVRICGGDKFVGDFVATYSYVAADGTTETRSEEWSFASETVTLPFPPFPSYEELTMTGVLGVVSDGGTVFAFNPSLIEGTDLEFTINLGCGDSGQYTCYNKTVDGTQYLCSPVLTDMNGKVVTEGALKFATDGFNVSVPEYGEGWYLTYGMFNYGDKQYSGTNDKGYVSLADLTVVRK